MAGIRLAGAKALCAVVQGAGDQADARAAYYAAVMGLAVRPSAEGPVLDLGPGGPAALALAEGVLAGFGHLSAETVRARLPSLRVVADSRVRAGGAAGRGLRSGSGEVVLQSARPAHAGFFGLDLLDLTHRRFDGSMSAPLRREVFVSGDAVTVLPWDPVRDRVLLIEQFRTGPLVRGDPLPWQLEAIAGRIDPGETPEEAARREAVEEAGLVLGRLEAVAAYYPSPGALTEFLFSYVALCDLPDGVAGLFGAEEEGEDIRGHLVSFDGLLAAVSAGEVANAPLILTALWLQRERERLRAGA